MCPAGSVNPAEPVNPAGVINPAGAGCSQTIVSEVFLIEDAVSHQP